MQFFWSTFPIAYHLTLVYIRGVLLLFLMLPWFDGVSYAFNFYSYVQGGCSGWVPMHFGEMNHLPYRHSSFHSYFGCNLPCLIDQLFRVWCFMSSVSSSSIVFLIWVVSFESTHVDYSLLYLVKFYCNGGFLDYQLLLTELYNFYMLHWCSTWSYFFVPIF